MKTKPLNGVNLGGWLVLERWITPDLFKGTDAQDEYTFCKQASASQLRKLQQFRDNFITKQDFEWLAAHGIEAVRLPVGHWVFGKAAPYMPTLTYVDKAFKWAQETGIRILIDLHGVPGSQNGQDHSGRVGAIDWDLSQVADTLQVIRKLATRYGTHPALLGISLLNEPSRRISKALLLDYYQKAYAIIRESCGDGTWIVYSDGYAPSKWRKELPHNQFKNVYIDVHHYQVFSPVDKVVSPRVHSWRARWQLPRIIARLQRHHPVIVGEWSLTLGGSRLRKRTTADQRRVMKSYGRLQITAYQSTAAWFFWTYRTEAGGTWSYRDCVEKDLL